MGFSSGHHVGTINIWFQRTGEMNEQHEKALYTKRCRIVGLSPSSPVAEYSPNCSFTEIGLDYLLGNWAAYSYVEVIATRVCYVNKYVIRFGVFGLLEFCFAFGSESNMHILQRETGECMVFSADFNRATWVVLLHTQTVYIQIQLQSILFAIGKPKINPIDQIERESVCVKERERKIIFDYVFL